jgi:CSLREA domain-containing protein
MSRVGFGSRIATALVLVGGLMGTAPAADAATLVVTKTADTDDGLCNADCSLREAVADANNGPATEVIRVPSGTYPLTGGELLINLHVVIEGAPEAVITRAAGTTGRIFNVAGGITATFRDLEITGGNVVHSGSTFDDNGGGIKSGGTLTLERVEVHHNTANDEGGGIWSNSNVLPGVILKDSYIHDNEAETRLGGGIHAIYLDVENSVISDNTAVGGSGAGGGIYVLAGNAALRDTTVARNVAQSGGGLYFNTSGSSTIEDSFISSNNGIGGGGGINNSAGTITVTRTTISSNLASAGAGIAMSDGSVQLASSTVADNSSGSSGGGLFANGGGYTLTNTTVSGNTAFGAGGGILLNNFATANVDSSTITNNVADWDQSNDAGEDGGGANIGPSALMTLDGSILAGNHDDSATVSHVDCSGPVAADYTIFGDDTGCTVTGTTNETASPNLGELHDNGGPTETHLIGFPSPALDFHTETGCGTEDQRGVPRPSGAACDSGAYERVECLGVAVNVVGTPSDDDLTGTNGVDGVLALGGNDSITTFGGDDAVCAGEGNDVVFGGDGADQLFGEAGRDKLYGEAGTDALDGGAGKKDKCFGGTELDTFTKCETKKQQGV